MWKTNHLWVVNLQGFGILAGAAISILVAGLFRDAYPTANFATDPIGSTPPEADFVWRIVVMFGAIPAALTYYWRMKMPETARFTALVEKNAAKAASDMATVRYHL